MSSNSSSDDSGSSSTVVLVGHLVELLNGYRYVLVAGVLVAVAMGSRFGVEMPAVAVPRWVKLSAFGFGAMAIPSYFGMVRIVNWLYSRHEVPVFEVDSEHEELHLYTFSPNAFERLVWEDGQPDTRMTTRGTAYVGQNFRYEQREAVTDDGETVTEQVPVIDGTWMGSASQLEFMEERSRIDHIKGSLESIAKAGLEERMKAPGVVQESVVDIAHEMAAVVEADTVFSGESIDSAFERAADMLGDDDGEEQSDDQSAREELVEEFERAEREDRLDDDGNGSPDSEVLADG